jgi:hypothetical protein
VRFHRPDKIKTSKDIADLTEELASLDLRRQEISDLLAAHDREATAAARSTSPLAIGQSVTILTPGRFKETSGKIVKITQTRVTVLTKNKRKIVRKHCNVQPTNKP